MNKIELLKSDNAKKLVGSDDIRDLPKEFHDISQKIIHNKETF